MMTTVREYIDMINSNTTYDNYDIILNDRQKDIEYISSDSDRAYWFSYALYQTEHITDLENEHIEGMEIDDKDKMITLYVADKDMAQYNRRVA